MPPGMILTPELPMKINDLQFPVSFLQIKLAESWTATSTSIESYLGDDISQRGSGEEESGSAEAGGENEVILEVMMKKMQMGYI